MKQILDIPYYPHLNANSLIITYCSEHARDQYEYYLGLHALTMRHEFLVFLRDVLE